MESPAGNSRILGNNIGTNLTGDALIANGSHGIMISNSANNEIADNLVCGSGVGYSIVGGIQLNGPYTSNNVLARNYIGTNQNGDTGLGNSAHGIEMFGLRPLQNSSLSVIITIRSGLAYFWSPEYQYDYQVESNRRYPMESQTDLRFDKNFPISVFDIKLGVRVINLFDNQHMTPISETEELNRYVLRGATYADADNNPNRDVYLYNYFQAWRNIPRQFFLTLGFLF